MCGVALSVAISARVLDILLGWYPVELQVNLKGASCVLIVSGTNREVLKIELTGVLQIVFPTGTTLIILKGNVEIKGAHVLSTSMVIKYFFHINTKESKLDLNGFDMMQLSQCDWFY